MTGPTVRICLFSFRIPCDITLRDVPAASADSELGPDLLATVGIAVTMIGAIATHVRRSETNQIARNIVFIALAAFIAWGRFIDYPL